MIKMINVFVYNERAYDINWICCNRCNATYGFNTKYFFKKNINYWIEMFKMKNIMVKKTQG